MRGVIKVRTPFRLRAFLLALAAALLVSIAVCLVPAQRAYADLTVYVGYAGGPYYEKASFTDAELSAMSDGYVYQYSSIDGAGSIAKGYGYGVQLYDLFTAAGVDPSAMWRFYFDTADRYVEDDGGAGNGAWYYSSLVGTPRYYYPDLPKYYDFDDQEIQSVEAMTLLEQTRQKTPTILAIASSFVRVNSADDSLWNDRSFIGTSHGYRLLYGQTAPNISTSASSAHSIVSMTCILGGAEGANKPDVDLGAEVDQMELSVGESVTLFPTLNSEDATVSAMGIHDITWTSSNPEVAQVVKNADGSITIYIVGEGTVSIGYSYGNSQYEDFLTKGSFGVSGTGAGSGSGAGDGDDESGDDSQSGEGFAESVALSAGTEVFSASVDASSSGGSAALDSSDGTGETVVAEEMLQITATPSVYELDFEDPDLVDDKPAWGYALAAGSLLAVGGARQRLRFEHAKDKYMGVGSRGAGPKSGFDTEGNGGDR